MASHSCCKELNDHPRNLTDDQIKLIIKRNGFIGINFFPEFLVGKGNVATSDDIVNHIKHIFKLGGIDNVGLGSDFSGIEYTPVDMTNCATFNVLYKKLKVNGFSEQELTKICYKNFYDFYFNKF
jgi:membrane dipeptidase